MDLPALARPGNRAAGELVGGQRRDRLRRRDLRGQHGRRRLRDQPRRQRALGVPHRELGLDRAGDDPRRAHLLGVAGPRHLRRGPAGPAAVGVHRPRVQRLLAGAQPRRVHASTPDRSTATSTRSTRAPAGGCGRSPQATTCTARRPWPRTRAVGPRPSTWPRRTGRSMRSARAGGSCGATTRATPSAPRPCSGAPPQRRWPGALRGLVEWVAVRHRRRVRAPALVVRQHSSRPGAARPQRPERVTRARHPRRVRRRRARPPGLRAVRLLPAQRATGAATRDRARRSRDGLTRVLYATPGGNTRSRVSGRLPAATIVNGRLVVRRRGRTVDASRGRPRPAAHREDKPAVRLRRRAVGRRSLRARGAQGVPAPRPQLSGADCRRLSRRAAARWRTPARARRVQGGSGPRSGSAPRARRGGSRWPSAATA